MVRNNKYVLKRQVNEAEGGLGAPSPHSSIISKKPIQSVRNQGLSLATSMEARRELQKVSRFVACELIDGKVQATSAVGRCGKWCATDGKIVRGPAGLKWTGFETCKSSFCPYCGVNKAKSFREELKTSVERLKSRGGTILFGTATSSREGRSLSEVVSAHSKAIGSILQGSFREKLKDKFGYLGHYCRPEVQIRLEYVNDGQGDYHPHIHLLMFFDFELDDEELQEIDNHFFIRWKKQMTKSGLKVYREFTRLERPSNEDAASAYITKLAGSLSLEMTSLDTKTGKNSVSYFQLLKLIKETEFNNSRFIKLAKVYQREMKGRRFMSVSINLRRELLPELFSPNGVELTEEEVEEFFEKMEEEEQERQSRVVIDRVPQSVGAAASKLQKKSEILRAIDKCAEFRQKFIDLCNYSELLTGLTWIERVETLESDLFSMLQVYQMKELFPDHHQGSDQ